MMWSWSRQGSLFVHGMLRRLLYEGRAEERDGVEGVVTVVKVKGFCSWLGKSVVVFSRESRRGRGAFASIMLQLGYCWRSLM